MNENMRKSMIEGIVITMVSCALAVGGMMVFQQFQREPKPIEVVKEAYEEYGYNYALKIIKENQDEDNHEEWLDAINYLGEAKFGILWESVK